MVSSASLQGGSSTEHFLPTEATLSTPLIHYSLLRATPPSLQGDYPGYKISRNCALKAFGKRTLQAWHTGVAAGPRKPGPLAWL